MITKELFMDCMKSYKKYYDWENKVADLGINIWEREEVQNMISAFMSLLQYCCKDIVSEEDKYDPTNIDWFIYDNEWGEKSDEYYILSDDDSKEYHLKTVDDLWNYLVEIHPEIVDNEGSDNTTTKQTNISSLEFLKDIMFTKEELDGNY